MRAHNNFFNYSYLKKTYWGTEITLYRLSRMTSCIAYRDMNSNPHNTFGKGLSTRAVNGGNDAYFTKPEIAELCLTHLRRCLRKWRISLPLYLEPAAGNGVWLDQLPAKSRSLAFDINPQHPYVHQGNFYHQDVPRNCVVIGNPPFGFAAREAIGFFNHAAGGARVIAFIVPRTFKKQSVQNKLDRQFHLEFELDLPEASFTVDGDDRSVPCCFQIWRRKRQSRKAVELTIANPWFEFTTPERADFSVRRVGGQAGKVLEGTDYSLSSTYFIRSKINERTLRKAFYAIDLAVVDHTAGVRSISKRELVSLVSDQLSQSGVEVQ